MVPAKLTPAKSPKMYGATLLSRSKGLPNCQCGEPIHCGELVILGIYCRVRGAKGPTELAEADDDSCRIEYSGSLGAALASWNGLALVFFYIFPMATGCHYRSRGTRRRAPACVNLATLQSESNQRESAIDLLHDIRTYGRGHLCQHHGDGKT